MGVSEVERERGETSNSALVMAQRGGILSWIKTFWTDRFKWDCVKSIGLFVLGVVVARDMQGLSVVSQ